MSNSFYLDIYNNILNYKKNQLLIIFDIDGNIWFKLRDLLKIIGYEDPKDAIKNLDLDNKYIKKYKSIIRTGGYTPPILNSNKNFIMINNSGLFFVLSKSTKPLAKKFMKKYIEEIMPYITSTGKYISSKEEMNKIHLLNNKIKTLKNENNLLINSQSHIVYPSGKYIYIIKQKINNKTFYKVGYTKNLNFRIKTYNTGNVNKIKFNYIIPILNEDIDKCIKNIMKNNEWIKNKEQYKISLKEALHFIKNCDNNIKIIMCGKCLKKYSFNKMLLHKCKI